MIYYDPVVRVLKDRVRLLFQNALTADEFVFDRIVDQTAVTGVL